MYQIEELPQVWVDTCLRDSDGRLMFVSAYGRDGSLMQLLAAIELGSSSERGLSRFHLIDPMGQRHRVDVGDPKRLSKHSTRLPRQNLFGPLGQLWLFDQSLRAPDRANRIGWVLHQTSKFGNDQAKPLQERVWQLIQLLSPVALEEHWREPVLTWCLHTNAVQSLDDPLHPALGPIEAMRVSLTDHFVNYISESVREGALTLQAC